MALSMEDRDLSSLLLLSGKQPLYLLHKASGRNYASRIRQAREFDVP